MTYATELLGNTAYYNQEGQEISTNTPNEKIYTYVINYGTFIAFQ